MTALSEACARRPFSNGTEGEAWMSAWCAYCTHDHGMTHHDGCGDGCEIVLHSLLGMPNADYPWPEVWLPEPDDGQFALPSRLVCLQFEPCTQGDCTGDPGAADRAERVQEVRSYWMGRR